MFLDDGGPLVQVAACSALSLITRIAALPLSDDSPDGELSKREMVDRLIALIKSNKTGNKVKERAIAACGNACIGEQFPFAGKILESLLELSREVIITGMRKMQC